MVFDPKWNLADCIARHRKYKIHPPEIEACLDCNHDECPLWPAHYPGEENAGGHPATKAAGRVERSNPQG